MILYIGESNMLKKKSINRKSKSCQFSFYTGKILSQLTFFGCQIDIMHPVLHHAYLAIFMCFFHKQRFLFCPVN